MDTATSPQVTQTMRSVVQDRYGPDADTMLRLTDVPRPTIGDGDVLVRVAAASVDMGTAHLVTGLPYAPNVVRRGDWVVTDANSAASLTLGARNEVLVERGSKVCIEDRGLGRLLFDSGALVVRGPRTVTTRVGVIELEQGELRISGGGQAAEIELRQGACVVIDAHGERRLAPGERVRLGS